MNKVDLTSILKQCSKSADVGYKIASQQKSRLNSTLMDASVEIQNALYTFKESPCYVPGALDLLENQLVDIGQSFEELSVAFEDDLAMLKKNRNKFSITLFGRTMAGKSTLREFLTHGDGSTIGLGAQRTTKDVHTYKWHGLEITDVPGIGAFEGETDEQIAFEAAKSADLILFLITDDAPQAIDAECFGQIVNLGKPIICIINVKAVVSESKSLKMNLRGINKSFDMDRLNTIKRQFLDYSNKLGQDWGYIPFAYVHLKAAYLAQQAENPEISQALYEASRISFLTNKILMEVTKKGEFYRIKNFVDIIANPLLRNTDCLLDQSQRNSASGRTILAKKRDLASWSQKFEISGKQQIRSLIVNIKSALNSEVAAFAENNFSNKNADKEWSALLKKRKVEKQCMEMMESLEEECNSELAEISREISNELQYSNHLALDRSLKMHKIIDLKKGWNWGTIIVSGGLYIADGIAMLIGSTISGPLGWAALVATGIGFVGSLLFKSRDKKEHEARIRLENNLRKNVDAICKSLEGQMNKGFTSLMDKKVHPLLEELERINSVVFDLADTQKKLAWRLNDHLLELNSQIMAEAIKLIGADGLQYHILAVARIPGNVNLLMLNDGTYFPDEQKIELRHLMNESIGFVYYNDDKRIVISRVLGKSVERYKISIEEKIGVAHVPFDNDSPKMINKVRLAQQFTELLIMK